MNKFNQTLLGGLLCLMTSNAIALVLAPITGTLEMTGSASVRIEEPRFTEGPIRAVGVGPSIAIDFNRNKFIATSGDGDFTGVSRIGDIQSFQLDPFLGSITNFWSIDDFSFTLTDLMFDVNSTGGAGFLSITGNGVLSASGFADSDASWRLSGNTTGGGLFGWSATVTAASSDVPEPGLLALLSLGLIAMVVRRRISQ